MTRRALYSAAATGTFRCSYAQEHIGEEDVDDDDASYDVARAHTPIVTSESSVEDQKFVVAFLTERWFEYGNIQIRPRWGIAQAPFTALVLPNRRSGPLDPDPLAGVLALELAATLASPTGISVCAETECRYPYTHPSGGPDPGSPTITQRVLKVMAWLPNELGGAPVAHRSLLVPRFFSLSVTVSRAKLIVY